MSETVGPAEPERTESPQAHDLPPGVWDWPTLMRHFPDIVAVLDRTGKVLALNRTASGRSPEEILGASIRDFVHPSHAASVMEHINRACETHTVQIFELLGTGAEGPESAWYENRVVPIERDGRVVAVTFVGTDITERRRAVEALSRSEALWRSLLITSPDGITTTDLEGKITFASQRTAELHGYPTREAMLGMDSFELVAPEDREKALANARKTLTEGGIRNVEYRLLRSDGTSFLGELDASSITDDDGNVTGFIATTRDITERRRAEEERAQLEERLRQALLRERDALAQEAARLRAELGDLWAPDGIIGRDAKMRELFDHILTVSPTDASVLIQGETGTGKELVARAIHYNSRRWGKPLVKVDCGGLVGSLLESELFGHVRGAFTDAVRDRKGRIEAADGGTVFMDEVQNLRTDLQSKLLRVVEDGSFERVGSNTTQTVNVRFVAATNENIHALVENGSFRRDLFYRLNVVFLRIPPLRERIGDLPLLAEHFLTRFAKRHGRDVLRMTRPALEALMAYSWPGNVRELENVIEQSIVLCRSDTIGPDDIRLPSASADACVIPARGMLSDAAEAVEKRMLESALARSCGNRKRAATLLGISRSSLYGKLRKHGLGPKAPSSAASSVGGRRDAGR